MAINTIALATIFQRELDKLAVQESVTGWMTANDSGIIYNGGKTIKIPKMTMDGLGNYDRDAGYPQGGITVEYQEMTMTQDRGRKFQLDAMDVDESNFVATAAAAMGEFQRMYVIPEIDAYRISMLATKAINAHAAEFGYTPAAATIEGKIRKAINALKKKGFKPSEIAIHISIDAMGELQDALSKKLTSVTWSVNGIDTTVPSIDGAALIETADDRMYTALTMKDGKTSGQTEGGFGKASTGKDINFLAVGRRTPVAVTKQDKIKIFTPDQNQDADAWKLNYRRYHDVWVPDNQVGGLYVNVKDVQ